MNKPTKEQIQKFIDEGEAFAEKVDVRLFAPPSAGGVVQTPNIPWDFIDFFKAIVAAFPAGTFPQFERAIADPGDPDMHEVLKDLNRARQMV
jgi:hypothetical protein